MTKKFVKIAFGCIFVLCCISLVFLVKTKPPEPMTIPKLPRLHNHPDGFGGLRWGDPPTVMGSSLILHNQVPKDVLENAGKKKLTKLEEYTKPSDELIYNMIIKLSQVQEYMISYV
jgi:hypothetical protein